MKKCARCEKQKQRAEFYGTAKLSARCRDCHGLAARVCKICKSNFIAKPRVTMCSTACRLSDRPQTFKNCEQCGARFGPIDHLNRRFCGYECKAQSQLGQAPWNKGKIALQLRRSPSRPCLRCGLLFRATADWKHKRQIYCSHRCYLANRRVSQPEIAVGHWLREAGIEALPQHRLGRWTFDFYAPALALLIEVDGAFWHSSPTVQERDRRKDADSLARGLRLIRIDADAVTKNVEAACAPIKGIKPARRAKATGAAAAKAGGPGV